MMQNEGLRRRRCIVSRFRALTSQAAERRPLVIVARPAAFLPIARRDKMYLARFCYDVQPVDRQRAIDFIRREVEAARKTGLDARLLVPLTRGHANTRPHCNSRLN
jgi:hypothetical protein